MAAWAILLAAGSMAWAQTTTGRLIGTVVDDSGVPLPGITVTIASPAQIGGPQTRVTDDGGEFSFLLLAPGDYTVTAALLGFFTQERSEVKVPLGGAAAMAIAMPAGTFSGEIEVVDETPVVDPTQASAGQVFEQAYMQESAIGSANRDYLVVVNQAAGVAGGGSWGNIPQPRVFGSTVGENAYFIDGVNATDPVMMIGTVDTNFDAIGEIQLLTRGFEAEHGFATGGIVNLVTRSGGNDFSGTLDLRYRDDSFQESGDHFDAGELSSKHEVYGATLGGPILSDRLWFFASYLWRNDEFTPIASPTTYDDEARSYIAKVTWQAHPSWRAAGKYSTDPITTENLWASRWVMPEAGAYAHGSDGVSSIQLSAVLSESLLWETTVGRYEIEANVYPMSGDLQTIGHYNYDTGLYTANYDNQQYWTAHRNEFATDLTWFVDNVLGSHELKAGLEYADLEFSMAYCSTGTPNGERCIPGGVGFFFLDVEHEGAALPWHMWEYTTAGPGEYTGGISTGFVQDAWQVARDLTLKVGLRYDAVRYETTHDIQVADMEKWQPRIGIAWDVTRDAKTLLRASWGRFLHPSTLSLPWNARADAEPYDLWYSCSGMLPLSLGIPVERGSMPEQEYQRS
jgi:outer membrane receptor protein involved in Fe transport